MMSDFGAGLAERLSTPDGQAKMADLSGKVIFDRLREVSFASPLLNMRPIGVDECQISENTDTFTKVEFMEPNSRAMTMNFRADSQVRIIKADRAFMSFYTIASEVFQKTEQELQIYRSIPVSQILEQNTLKDMQEIRDHGFITHCEAAIQAMQAEANGGTAPILNATTLQGATPPVEFAVIKGEGARSASVNNAVPLTIQRPDVANMKKLLSANRLEHSTLLMSAPDLDGLDSWTLEDNGDRIQSETVVEGYKYNKLLGLKVIKTIKTDILRPGNVYLFTAPQFLGRFYLLNKTKFYVDKRFNVISWQAWEDLGMLLLNVNSVKKLELYSGDASANDSNSIRSSVLPKAERDLGAKNNRVAEGVRFPKVVSILPGRGFGSEIRWARATAPFSFSEIRCHSSSSTPPRNRARRRSASACSPAPACFIWPTAPSASCRLAPCWWRTSGWRSTEQRYCATRSRGSSRCGARTTSPSCSPPTTTSRPPRPPGATHPGSARSSRRSRSSSWARASSTPARPTRAR